MLWTSNYYWASSSASSSSLCVGRLDVVLLVLVSAGWAVVCWCGGRMWHQGGTWVLYGSYMLGSRHVGVNGATLFTLWQGFSWCDEVTAKMLPKFSRPSGWFKYFLPYTIWILTSTKLTVLAVKSSLELKPCPICSVLKPFFTTALATG